MASIALQIEIAGHLVAATQTVASTQQIKQDLSQVFITFYASDRFADSSRKEEISALFDALNALVDTCFVAQVVQTAQQAGAIKSDRRSTQ